MIMEMARSASFQIGPEDIGKKVYVSTINKIGTVTSFTPEEVSVLTPIHRRPQRYKYSDCSYLRTAIRH